MNVTKQLLQENGKWSFKRISAAIAFLIALIYVFVKEDPKEFVFNGLLLYTVTAVGMTVANKLPVFNKPKNDTSGN